MPLSDLMAVSTEGPLPVSDGLVELVRFARLAMGADGAIAFEAGQDGLAVPLAGDPEPVPPPFSLDGSGIEAVDWNEGPVMVENLRLPTSVSLSLDRPVQRALLLRVPIDDAERSGVLLLWASNSAAHRDSLFRFGSDAGIAYLAPVFGKLLRDRRAALGTQIASDRFRDLFESVSTGIVILEGNGTSGLVNPTAAQLLGVAKGELDAYSIARPMRDLRARCVNAAELNTLYAPLQRNVDFSVTTQWDLGARQFEVDTHPLMGDGRSGRLWLFYDITAQKLVERDLRRLVATDLLTGLSSRRYFTEYGTAAFARPLDAEAPLSALMVDIDHFKSINDRYGHATGDRVLQAVSARMRTVLRQNDVIARLGGEEFAVLIEGSTRDDVLSVAERLRASVAGSPIITDTQAIDVHVSVGGAFRGPDAETLDGLLGRADSALYAAKRGGRNRVVFDGTSDSGG